MAEKRIFKQATGAGGKPEQAKPSGSPVEVPANLDPRLSGTALSGKDLPPELDPLLAAQDLPPEFGGVDGPEPTRYGDWEAKGRCTDF